MNVSKRICILITAALFLFTACGAFGEAAEPDYYRIGLKVTALMSEMMDSEAFLSILTRPEYFSEQHQLVYPGYVSQCFYNCRNHGC